MKHEREPDPALYVVMTPRVIKNEWRTTNLVHPTREGAAKMADECGVQEYRVARYESVSEGVDLAKSLRETTAHLRLRLKQLGAVTRAVEFLKNDVAEISLDGRVLFVPKKQYVLNLVQALTAGVDKAWKELAPEDMVLCCPNCGKQHLDIGEFQTRVHRTHLCENTTEGPKTGCGHEWKPWEFPTRGVEKVSYD